jgi:predicted NAD-dependent protein-ADP-ribosyltransferase YbiA (DUF1768 family)
MAEPLTVDPIVEVEQAEQVEQVEKEDNPEPVVSNTTVPATEPLEQIELTEEFIPTLPTAPITELPSEKADEPEEKKEEPMMEPSEPEYTPNMEDLRRFYEEGSKLSKRQQFRYDEKGDLVEFDKKGALIKTIALPTYRPPTEEEVRQMERERLERIKKENHTFEEARRKLYQALQDASSSPATIVDLQRDVRDADIRLQMVQFPLRYVDRQNGVKIRDMDFNQPQETRVLPYTIAFSCRHPFTLQQQYVRVGEKPLPQMVSVAETKAEETIILVSDREMETNSYGFLALGWPVSIRLEENVYTSARDAIDKELAKISVGKESPQWKEAMLGIMDKVHLAKFEQYPELAQRLIETPPQSILGIYEPNDTLMGIGIPLENIKSKDRFAWTGENQVGKTLMKVREIIMAKRAAEQQVKRPRKPRTKAASVQGVAAQSVAPAQEVLAEGPLIQSVVEQSVAPTEQILATTSTGTMLTPMGPAVKSVRRGPRIGIRQPAMPAPAMPALAPLEEEKYPL